MTKTIKLPKFPEKLPEFPNTWKTKSTRAIYKNPWIDVREDIVLNPKGKEGIYGVVDTRIATAVVALDPEMNVYIVGQYRYPINQYSWEVIEGGSEGKAGALETAKRELIEEAGLIANDWVQLGDEFYLSNCFSSEVGYVFLARDLEETQAQPEETEDLRLAKIPFLELLERVKCGEIKDALSIMAVYRAEHFLSLQK